MRRVAVRVILVTLATAAALGAAELGVRAAFPALDPSGQVSFAPWVAGGPPLGRPGAVLRQTKNTGDYDVRVAFGPDGFRERRELRSATGADLFVVGDSFAFGWGVEEDERFSSRLERLTGRRVLNLAIPAQDLEGYARLVAWARERGAPLRRLLVTVCLENDLRDYDAAPGERAAPAAGPLRRAWWRLRSSGTRLAERSALYALGTTAVHAEPALERLAARLGLVTPNLAGIPANDGSAGSGRILSSSIARCAALAAGADATFVLVPSRGLWTGPDRAVEREVHDRFAAGLRSAGLDVVDLRPDFEARPDPLSLHFAGDPHWNAAGHAVAARAIARHLLSNGPGDTRR